VLRQWLHLRALQCADFTMDHVEELEEQGWEVDLDGFPQPLVLHIRTCSVKKRAQSGTSVLPYPRNEEGLTQ